MFRFTKLKAAVWLILVALGLSPLFLVGSGPAVIVPVLEIFWLVGLAQGAGIQVTAGPGVDAFNLIPPNAVGITLIVVGFAIALAVQYALACVLVTLRSNGIQRNPAPDRSQHVGRNPAPDPPRHQGGVPRQTSPREGTSDVKLCPYCSAAMPRDATVCLDCGRNWQTGAASRSNA